MRPRPTQIRLHGVRQNNLKNISLDFPLRKWTVVTGVSGSGKSSLAFETLYAEGQRRFVDSLSTYTRQFFEKIPKPAVDSIENIPPALALEQRNRVLNSRSTVGSQTELVDLFRILWARLGKIDCEKCGSEVRLRDMEMLVQSVLNWGSAKKGGRKILLLAPVTAPIPKQVAAVLRMMREQGFVRLALDREVKPIEEWEELWSKKIPKTLPKQWELVMDRFKVPDTFDGTQRAELEMRLRDTVALGLRAGRSLLRAWDMDSAGDTSKNDEIILSDRFACVQCGHPHPPLEPNLLNANSPVGACSRCSGFGFTLELDPEKIVLNPHFSLKRDAIDPWSKPSAEPWKKYAFRMLEKADVSLTAPFDSLPLADRNKVWDLIREYFAELATKKYKLHVRVMIRRYQIQQKCPDCDGSRLGPYGRRIRLRDRPMGEVVALPLSDMQTWFESVDWSESEHALIRDLAPRISKRLDLFNHLGLGYLTADRLTRTLSGGEYQRVCLTSQLAGGLSGTLYVLDEPSIGLHAADTHRLIEVLRELRDLGNTLVVVEHDDSIMRAADHLVELGPLAGREGGQLIAQGDAKTFLKTPDSLTAQYLQGTHPILKMRSEGRPCDRKSAPRRLVISGATQNNLRNLTVEIPLERFVVVSGVSGSGKSTLIFDILAPNLDRVFEAESGDGEVDTGKSGQTDTLKIQGIENLAGLVLLDQKPIGKSSRSNPATYMKAWDEIRQIYAAQPLSIQRGYTPQFFSFNVDGGRCPTCSGDGEVAIDLHFMAEVCVPCEECEGRRFKKAILEVRYQGRNIFELLQTTIDECFEQFVHHPSLRKKLGLLREVGLGYLQLGQSATTLSGGESQRLKIAGALERGARARVLYLLDEPTTGLSAEDIRKLIPILQKLVDEGNSVLIVEHHIDLIRQADWIIDMGPGGGSQGGQIIAEGAPDLLAKNPKSVTGRYLLTSL